MFDNGVVSFSFLFVMFLTNDSLRAYLVPHVFVNLPGEDVPPRLDTTAQRDGSYFLLLLMDSDGLFFVHVAFCDYCPYNQLESEEKWRA